MTEPAQNHQYKQQTVSEKRLDFGPGLTQYDMFTYKSIFHFDENSIKTEKKRKNTIMCSFVQYDQPYQCHFWQRLFHISTNI